MTLQTQRLTYEEYLKSPEIKQRYEIVDGKMIIAPSPTREHQTMLRHLFLAVDRYVVERDLGEVLFAPLDVWLYNGSRCVPGSRTSSLSARSGRRA